MGEDKQSADSSTATTTAIWNMVLSFIEWNQQSQFLKSEITPLPLSNLSHPPHER